MKLRFFVAAALSLVLSSAAHAQTAGFYTYKDTATNIFNMKIWQTGSNPLITTPASVSSDGFGLPLSGAAGTTNPTNRALYVQGVTGGIPFHMICDSGCGGGGGGGGLSVPFGGAIGANGTPVGFKDSSGNFQPLLGDVTNGQWVNIKASVAIPVTGTFWQATQPISAASLPLPSGASTAANQASIITALGSPFQAGGSIGNTAFGISGTLPAFAATPTFNLGTAPTLTVTGSVSLTGTLPAFAATPTFNLGTLNGAATASLQTSGNASLTSIDSKTPALGQALAAGSVPIVLTAAQLTTLTPPAAITGFATAANQTAVIGSAGGGTAAASSLLSGGQYNSSPITLTTTQQAALQLDSSGYLKVNVVLGGGGSATFGAAFPSTGVALGVSQGGNLVAVTGTAGNLNVQCANCSGSGVSTADGAAFVAGTSLFAGTGGIYQTTATSNPLTNGTQGLAQLTINRALHVNLRTAAGVIMGDATTPLQVSLANTGANGTALLVTGTGGTFPVTGTVTANAGTNLNTSLLALESGGNLASLVTQIGAVTASPTANTVNDRLKTINTTLGTPFQAGGSIGNTSFAVTQATAASLNATVVGTGTFAVQLTGATNNINNISGTISLPTGAATAAKQPALGTAGAASADVITVQGVASMTALKVDGSGVTQPVSAASLPLPALAATSTKQSDGTQKTQIVDGSGNVIASTSNNLNVQCANCSGSGVSTADEASMTPGTSLFAGSGGFFQTTATSNPLTTGQQGMFQVTANRALFTNLRNASGTEIGTSTTPVQVSLANTATNATAVKVDGSAVTQPVSLTSTTLTGTSSVNTAQVNGVTTLTGTGAVGTGAQRVAIGTDTATIAGSAPGTAGTPSANVVTVQGTTSMTKLLVTPDSVALPANQSVNVAQMNGVTTTMGNGVAGTGVQRVAIASDNTAFTVNPASATAPVSTMNSASAAAGVTAAGAYVFDDVSPTAISENNFGYARMSANRNQYHTIRDAAGNERGVNVTSGNSLQTDLTSVAGTAATGGSGTTTAGTQRVVLATDQTMADPCMFQAKTNVTISTASGTTNLVTGVASKKVYVCSLVLVVPSAVSVSLSEGSATLCATSSQAGVIGVATSGTAANGMAIAANGGLTLGNGGNTVAATATAANYLCLFQSGTAQIAGNLTYVQQ